MSKEQDKLIIAQRRQRISTLYLQGKYQAEIAVEVGVTQQQVSYDLKIIHKEWLKSTLVDFDVKKIEELERVAILEREYWDAWRTSRADREIKSTAKETSDAVIVQGRAVGGKQKSKASVRKEMRDGNAAFLAGIQWCIDTRCRIFGFYAPTKLSITEIDAIIDAAVPELNDGRTNDLASSAIQ